MDTQVDWKKNSVMVLQVRRSSLIAIYISLQASDIEMLSFSACLISENFSEWMYFSFALGAKSTYILCGNSR